MTKRITVVAATAEEIQPLQEYLEANAVTLRPFQFQLKKLEIEILITGIGILHATYSLMNYLMEHKPDAWIQSGIGGAYDTSLELGKVYLIESEVLVDFGAQDKSGRIITQFELGWTGSDQFPYTNEVLTCPFIQTGINVPVASGMTTLHSHGFQGKIESIADGLHGQIENMEGAPFFYVSLMKDIPFLSLRSISNYVATRDTANWEIPLAIRELNKSVISLLNEKAEGANYLFI